jgi:uncharacterized protein (DUF362 family)
MRKQDHRKNRRQFLKATAGSILGAAMGVELLRPGAVLAQTSPSLPVSAKDTPSFGKLTMAAPVSIVKGNDRREIVYQSLKHLEDEILASIGPKRILIKPNFVSTNRELCATHVDAVRGILDFLQPHHKLQIMIGESTASRAGTFDGFKNYGYQALEKEYKVKLLDLNLEAWHWGYGIGSGNRIIPIRLISQFTDPNLYVISAAKMKTHDRVLTTLSLKNVLLGAPLNDYKKSDKPLMHTSNSFDRNIQLHFNMFHLAQQVYPDLGVIDGFVGMEGNGPVGGTPVDARLALASLDPLALDVMTTKLMGFDPSKIMYLNAMAEAGMGQADLAKIKVLGTAPEQCQYHFKASRRMIEPYGLG